MFCEQCGAELEPDARFCSTCGKQVEDEGGDSFGQRVVQGISSGRVGLSSRQRVIAGSLVILVLSGALFWIFRSEVVDVPDGNAQLTREHAQNIVRNSSSESGTDLGQDALRTRGATGTEDLPSDQQARRLVENPFSDMDLRDNDKKCSATVVDFRKLNGESREYLGQRFYIYHFLAAAELPDGFGWMPYYRYGIPNENPFVCRPYPTWEGIQTLSKGTTATLRGKVEFRWTDKGWISRDYPSNLQWGYCVSLKPEPCYKSLGWDKLR